MSVEGFSRTRTNNIICDDCGEASEEGIVLKWADGQEKINCLNCYERSGFTVDEQGNLKEL